MIDPKLTDAYPADVTQELEQVLHEIGEVRPVWDESCQEYGFSHPLYPSIDAPGDTPEECIQTYHRLLAKFLSERMKGNLAPHVDKMTQGRGGHRLGSGRPVGSKKEPKLRIYLPADVATWILDPQHIEQVRKIMGA